MNSNNNRKSLAGIIVILYIIFSNILISNQFIYQNLDNSNNYSLKNQKVGTNEILKTSAQQSFINVSWLKNGDFSSTSINPWVNTTQGDSRDIMASNSSGQADYVVLGEEGTIEISDVFQTPSEWIPFNKSILDNNPNNGYGVWYDGVNCSHLWSDPTANQIPKIYWKYNVSTGIDLSDYEISSSSIHAILNASVDRNVDVPGDSIAAYAGDDPEIGINRALNQFAAYDYVHFTVEVSDVDVSQDNTYVIAENRTRYLGRYDGLSTPYLELEKEIEPKNQTDINFFLSRVLEADKNGHDDFTIILGISIFSADNTAPNFDYDFFNLLRIKSVNLTFTYRKNIDKSTTLSWSQEGNMINYTSVQVIDATANFEYKIDKDWNKTTSSQFSEVRVLINNKMQKKYPNVKLVDYNYSKYQGNFIDAREGGYDLTSLITIKENISFSIQVYIGDNFRLDQTINISIDNVYLNISFIVFSPEGNIIIESGGSNGKGGTREAPWIFLIVAMAAIVGSSILGAYFLEYYFVLKYPKPIRKVRKYRRALNKKKIPNVDIISRQKAFKTQYQKHLFSTIYIGKTSKEIIIPNKIVKNSIKTSSNNRIQSSAKKQDLNGGDK